jgi:hypothetical protein
MKPSLRRNYGLVQMDRLLQGIRTFVGTVVAGAAKSVAAGSGAMGNDGSGK